VLNTISNYIGVMRALTFQKGDQRADKNPPPKVREDAKNSKLWRRVQKYSVLQSADGNP
jgi:hypothetical protein